MKTSDRQSNIELLRILAIAAVIVLHYNNANIGGDWHALMVSICMFCTS